MTNAHKQEGSRRLTTVRLEDGEYFIDNRLDEFRTVTPPIRPIEFIRFESTKGLRILDECVWQDCGRCGRMMAVARQSTESVTWCCDCGEQMPVPAPDHADPLS